MTELYWRPGASTWTYRHYASPRVLGRIDYFEDVIEIGYWWQTSDETGICSTLSSARRCVERAVWLLRSGRLTPREARDGDARAVIRRREGRSDECKGDEGVALSAALAGAAAGETERPC
jgi:hypothetical protein